MSIINTTNTSGPSISDYWEAEIRRQQLEAMKNMAITAGSGATPQKELHKSPPAFGFDIVKIDNGYVVHSNFSNRRRMYAKDLEEVGRIVTSMLVAEHLEDK